MADFPQYYPLFAQKEFAFDGRAPQNTRNRNPLLRLNIGADGLKTGHTEESGYGLVGSAKQGERRVIFAMSGLASQAQRAEEARAHCHLVLPPVCRTSYFGAHSPFSHSQGMDGQRNQR